MNVEERINKARLNITLGNSFFAYLSLYIKLKKAQKGDLSSNAGMGVNARGDVFYNEEWVKTISDAEIKGVILHEILHCALLHLTRVKKRDPQLWNIAIDLVTNSLLLKEGYSLPEGLRPDKDDCFTMYDFKKRKEVIIENISKKTAEEIYAELPEIPTINICFKNRNNGNSNNSDGNNSNGQGKKYKSFDEHLKGTDGKGTPLTESEIADLEDKWLSTVSQAVVSGLQRGDLPQGLERYAEELRKAEIDWRVLLRKYIQAMVPIDQTYAKMSKKSHALRIYMPGTLKEKIRIAVAIDTSGSLDDSELAEFLSEVVGIVRAYRDAIDITVFSHDIEVQTEHEVTNGNIQKIFELRNKLKGGGGTSHKIILKKISEEREPFNCAVFFTDGYSDLEEISLNDYSYKKIFVISKKGTIPTFNGKAIAIKKGFS